MSTNSTVEASSNTNNGGGKKRKRTASLKGEAVSPKKKKTSKGKKSIGETWNQWKETIKQTQNPFWKETVILSRACVNYSHPKNTNRSKGCFTLSKKCSLKSFQDNENFLHVRLFNIKQGSDIEWKSVFQIKLNGKKVQINERKARKVPVSKPVLIPEPQRVNSSFLNEGGNLFEIILPIIFHGFIIIQVVKKLLKSVPKDNVASQTSKNDDDLAEVGLTVGIRCPLSFTKIEIPVKGRTCNHSQCFDYESFLLFSKEQYFWYCPICHLSLYPSDIFFDCFFKRILDSIGDDDDEDVKIEINENGSFQRVALPASQSSDISASLPKRTISSSNLSSTGSFVVISLLDDEDPPITPPPIPPPVPLKRTSLPIRADPASSTIWLYSSDEEGGEAEVPVSAVEPEGESEIEKGEEYNPENDVIFSSSPIEFSPVRLRKRLPSQTSSLASQRISTSFICAGSDKDAEPRLSSRGSDLLLEDPSEEAFTSGSDGEFIP